MKPLYLFGFVAVVVLSSAPFVSAKSDTTPQDVATLPLGSEIKPEAMPHFPNRLQAFVFRNWNLVPCAKLASVVGASEEQIIRMAKSLGLPEYKAPKWGAGDLYITLIKRNWHLLPYEQLLELVDMTPERLNSVLREDDFLWVKLGQNKPRCEKLVYTEPTADELRQAHAIKQTMQRCFKPKEANDGKALFSFVDEIKHVDKESSEKTVAPNNGKSLRFIYSYLTLYGDPLMGDKDIFAEGLLEKLSKSGVNGVWLHVLLRDLAPGGEAFPEFGKGCEKRLSSLKRAVNMAAKYGIQVYLYLNEPRAMHRSFFENSQVKGRLQTRGVREGDYYALCTSNEDVRTWIRDALSYVFTQVPGLGGVFTISGSENLTFCNSHGGWKQCPQCSKREGAEVTADANALIAEGVHRAAPDAKVILWDWGWNRHGIATDIISKLPQDVWLMSVSEWALPIERGGVKSKIGEYSLSAVGPGPRAKTHWECARQHGLKTAAKIQLNCSWELSCVPYLPVMDLIVEHCSNLAQCHMDGYLMSWSLGAYPSPNLKVPLYFDRTPLPTKEQVLDEMAVDRYGEKGAPLARKAWTQISEAYREYPFSGAVLYYSPVQIGVANLLRAQNSGYHASMTGFPYDDLKQWRSIYPADVFEEQFRKMASAFSKAIPLFEQAAMQVDKAHRAGVMDDVHYVKVAQIQFESVANQTRYILLRDQAATATASDQKQALTSQMRQIVKREMQLSVALARLMQLDSKIGFESANQYLFVQNDLWEKVINCQHILNNL